jgi:hypothetical protein
VELPRIEGAAKRIEILDRRATYLEERIGQLQEQLRFAREELASLDLAIAVLAVWSEDGIGADDAIARRVAAHRRHTQRPRHRVDRRKLTRG